MNVHIGAIPSRWRNLFRVELPLVAGTVVYFVVSPESYLADVLGIAAPDTGTVDLLLLYAGSVGSLVFWTYARLLFLPDPHLPSFRAFQEGLLIGDLEVVGVSLQMLAERGPTAALGAQLAMATAWGVLRGVFLLRVR